jgi:hypothetical protein
MDREERAACFYEPVLAESSICRAGPLSRARERGSPVVYDEESGWWIDADGPFSVI